MTLRTETLSDEAGDQAAHVLREVLRLEQAMAVVSRGISERIAASPSAPALRAEAPGQGTVEQADSQIAHRASVAHQRSDDASPPPREVARLEDVLRAAPPRRPPSEQPIAAPQRPGQGAPVPEGTPATPQVSDEAAPVSEPAAAGAESELVSEPAATAAATQTPAALEDAPPRDVTPAAQEDAPPRDETPAAQEDAPPRDETPAAQEDARSQGRPAVELAPPLRPTPPAHAATPPPVPAADVRRRLIAILCLLGLAGLLVLLVAGRRGGPRRHSS